MRNSSGKGSTGDACDDDIDGDAAVNEADCAPLDPAIHPAADEVCNGIDDNCLDGPDEEWPELGVACDGIDGDQCANGTYTCQADGSATECVNESIEDILEACGDEIDNDCDGVTNEQDAQDCVNYYVDGDLDEYGAGAPACLCAPDDRPEVRELQLGLPCRNEDAQPERVCQSATVRRRQRDQLLSRYRLEGWGMQLQMERGMVWAAFHRDIRAGSALRRLLGAPRLCA